MNKSGTHTIYTQNLITLCYILDEYKEFKNRLQKLMGKKCNMDFIRKIDNVARGEFSWSIKALEFYNKNKAVIDTINKHTNMSLFINDIYDCEWNEINLLDYYYDYIKNHRYEMDKILKLLYKIKQLHITTIDFSEKLDFSQETYELYTFDSYNNRLVLLDNLEVLPGYSSDIIKYKTNDSNYRITLSGAFGNFERYRNINIEVNSLVFNSNRLPDYISVNEILGEIIGLKDKKITEYDAIKTSVDLNVSIDDLYCIFNRVNKKIKGLNDSKEKEELIKMLSTIKATIMKMQNITEQIDSDIVRNSEISNNTLAREKQLYKRKRYFSQIRI